MSPLAALLDLEGQAAESGWLEEALTAVRPGTGGARIEARGAVALGAGGRAELRAAAGSDLWIAAEARLDDRATLLEALPPGAAPETGSAADAIAAAYRAWGGECCRRLVGPFAFVIWDAAEQLLFAARDPMGSRSLHYSLVAGKRLLVASDSRQLVAAPGVGAALDRRMVAAHLAGLPGKHEWSFFAAVTQLPPGHTLSLRRGGAPRVERFWEIAPRRGLGAAGEEECDEAFRSAFRQAVACRLGRSQRLAVHLSGGLDSGAIAAVAAGLLADDEERRPLTAISWAFEELPECDERERSDRVVARHGLVPEYLPADGHWLWSDAEAAAPADDPTLVICPPLLRASLRHARGLGVGVVLGGGGGNAVVGGRLPNLNELLLAGRWAALARDLPALRRAEGAPWAGLVWRYLVRPLLRPGGKRPVVVKWPDWVSASLRREIELDRLQEDGGSTARLEPRSRAQRFGLVHNASETRALLAERRMAENVGVRYRLPFRDLRLFELVMALPVDQLWRAGEEKVVVRRALADVVPARVREPGSVGTLEPLRSRGLRDREAPRVQAWLRDPLIAQAGWVEPEPLRRAYDSYRTGRGPEFPMNLALELEAWLRQIAGGPR